VVLAGAAQQRVCGAAGHQQHLFQRPPRLI
jgi:hypothetical protein